MAAPADRTATPASTTSGSPSTSPISRVTRPAASTSSERMRAPVRSRTLPPASAGPSAQVSASDLAPSRHGKPSQVWQRTQVPPGRRSMPIDVLAGCRPCDSSRAIVSRMYGSCGSGGYGKGLLRQGSDGSSPVVPWTR